SGMQCVNEAPEERDAEELGLGEEEDLPRRRSPHHGRVENALVIRHDEGGSGEWYVLRPRDAESEPPPHQGDRRHLQDRVQHRDCSTTSRIVCTTDSRDTPVESTMI